MDRKIITVLTAVVMSASVTSAEETKAVDEKADFKAHDAKFLDEEAREKWLAEMRTKLPIARRVTGPFGFSQTPGVVVKRKETPKRSDAFLKAIGKLQITAVMPSDDKFAIGSREFTEGEVLPMEFNGTVLNVEIVAVRINSILFKNTDTGELVKKAMNELPAGLSRSNRIESVPGVTPASKGKSAPFVVQ
ncbi:hypothetical protein NT6N_35380 [Oceaniferula spumae]|uniref:Uncharacterized protein n=1 Tax=Oceaniferula spumae TaxID=2979115 RepID=A0AAT9FR95_9BACT